MNNIDVETAYHTQSCLVMMCAKCMIKQLERTNLDMHDKIMRLRDAEGHYYQRITELHEDNRQLKASNCTLRNRIKRYRERCHDLEAENEYLRAKLNERRG